MKEKKLNQKPKKDTLMYIFSGIGVLFLCFAITMVGMGLVNDEKKSSLDEDSFRTAVNAVVDMNIDKYLLASKTTKTDENNDSIAENNEENDTIVSENNEGTEKESNISEEINEDNEYAPYSKNTLEASGIELNRMRKQEDTWVYTIKYGDTLTKLSKAFGYSVDELAKFNSIRNVNLIYAESSLRIPNN